MNTQLGKDKTIAVLTVLCASLAWNHGPASAAQEPAGARNATAPKLAMPAAEEILKKMKEAPLHAKSLVAEMQIKDFLGADGKPFVVNGKFKGLPEKNLFDLNFARSQMSNGKVWIQDRQVCDGKFEWTICEAGGVPGAGAIRKCSSDVANQYRRDWVIPGLGAGGDQIPGGLIWSEGTPSGPLEVLAYDELFAFPDVTEETFEGVKVYRLQGRVRPDLVAKVHQKCGKYGAKYEPGACCLYVGKEDFILRQATILDMSGNVAKWTHFSIQTDALLDEKLFAYSPPTGAAVSDVTETTSASLKRAKQ